MCKTLLKNAITINENGNSYRDILIEKGFISKIDNSISANNSYNIIDCSHQIIIPGVIDDQVHFREPGNINKATIATESLAAVLGGTTSFMDMPNNTPPATTIEAIENKNQIASRNSYANYSFLLGATDSNLNEIKSIDPRKIAGVKVFMGSSTGSLLVDKEEALRNIFINSQVPIATHCEDNNIIAQNYAQFKNKYGEENLEPSMHPLIRSREACFKSTKKAVELAKETNANLHVFHLSTKEELELFRPFSDIKVSDRKITCEVCVHHLFFNDSFYSSLGNKLKCNPAVKTENDRQALIKALKEGVITNVATDHAPHTYEEKQQPYYKAPSGLPLIQFSLLAMLELVHRNELEIEDVVTAMCHNVADRYNIEKRGYIREGYFADLVVIDPNKTFTVKPSCIVSKCGWSPFTGMTFNNSIAHTFVNGQHIVKDGVINMKATFGKALSFDR
ncbi:MAG: dihydroorotase [Succinivibrionaceae bacterium]